MSRILKRPMFKRGGQSNDGIMSNVVDRSSMHWVVLMKKN